MTMTRKILVDVTALRALFDGGEALLLAKRMEIMSEIGILAVENMDRLSIKRLRRQRALRQRIREIDATMDEFLRDKRSYLAKKKVKKGK